MGRQVATFHDRGCRVIGSFSLRTEKEVCACVSDTLFFCRYCRMKEAKFYISLVYICDTDCVCEDPWVGCEGEDVEHCHPRRFFRTWPATPFQPEIGNILRQYSGDSLLSCAAFGGLLVRVQGNTTSVPDDVCVRCTCHG